MHGVMIWPNELQVRVSPIVDARHDFSPVNPVLECLDTCLELQEQEHDLSGDPLHAN